MAQAMLDTSFLQFVGLIGAMLYLGSFSLTAMNKLPSTSCVYYMAKVLASLMVGISLLEHFNLASAVIQVCYFVIAVVGIMRCKFLKRQMAQNLSQNLPQNLQ